MKELPSLKEFIEASLTDICEAVENVRGKHDYVAKKFFTDPNSPNKATNVEFDIAVTVSDTNSSENKKIGEAGISFKVGVMGGDAGFDAEKSDSEKSQYSKESRIKFSVPVYFQYDDEKRKEIETQIKKSRDAMMEGCSPRERI